MGCVTETNTAKNPEVGAATGAALHNEKLVMEGKSNPDVTSVPIPESGRQTDVPTVPTSLRDLGQKEFMANCIPECEHGGQPNQENKPILNETYCRSYCGCTYGQMRRRVPILDLRTFARGDANPSQGLIDQIIGQCAQQSKALEKQNTKSVLQGGGTPQTDTNASQTFR